MKKILIALLVLSMLATACTGKNNDETNNNQNETNGETTTDTTADTTDDNTLGDDNGDGKIEDETDGGQNTDNGNTDNGEVNFENVDKVESADDAVNFIGGNVYSLCKDMLPMYTETRALSTDDMDAITYNTGLTDISGINDVIISESMVGSIAYSLIMLRTDGTNTEDIQTALGDSVDPAKWICVSAEKISSIKLDNDIILVMGASDQVDKIMSSITEAAAGVYTDIGSVVNVLG